MSVLRSYLSCHQQPPLANAPEPPPPVEEVDVVQEPIPPKAVPATPAKARILTGWSDLNELEKWIQCEHYLTTDTPGMNELLVRVFALYCSSERSQHVLIGRSLLQFYEMKIKKDWVKQLWEIELDGNFPDQ